MPNAEEAIPRQPEAVGAPIVVGSGFASPIAPYVNPYNGREEAAYVGPDGQLMYLTQSSSGEWDSSPFPQSPSVLPGGGVVAAWNQPENSVLNIFWTDDQQRLLGLYWMTDGGWAGPYFTTHIPRTEITSNLGVTYQPSQDAKSMNPVIYGFGDGAVGKMLYTVSWPGWQQAAFGRMAPFQAGGQQCYGEFGPASSEAATGIALAATTNRPGWTSFSSVQIKLSSTDGVVYSGLGMTGGLDPVMNAYYPQFSDSPALEPPVKRVLATTVPQEGSSETNTVYYLDSAENLMFWPQTFATGSLIAVPGARNTAVASRVANQNPTFCTCVDTGEVFLLQGSGWGFGGQVPIFQPASRVWPPGAVQARPGSFQALALDQYPAAPSSYLFGADEHGALWYFETDSTGAWTATPVQTRGRIGVAPLLSNQANTTAGWVLLPGDSVTGNAHNDYPALTMRTDGNLVYQNAQGTETWSSATFGKGAMAALTPSGMFVVYDASYNVLWSAYAAAPSSQYVELQVKDSSVALVDASGRTLWSQPS